MSKLQKIMDIILGTDVPATLETVTQKFVDVVSGDMVLRVDGEELIVGAAVAQVIVAEDGTETIEPLADGDYTLEVGQMLVVVNSTITEIKPTEVEEPESEVEVTIEAEETVEAEVAPEAVTSPEMLLEALNALEARILALEEANTQMSSQLQEFAKAPGAPAVKTEKVGFSKFNKEENDDKLMSLSKLR